MKVEALKKQKYCSDCKLSFSATNFRRHRRRKHGEERVSSVPKQCPYCGKSKRNTNLSRHIRVCKQKNELENQGTK